MRDRQFARMPLALAITMFALVFFTGGSARSDVSSLLFLRPLSVIILFLGLCTLKREHVKHHAPLFAIAFVILAFLLLSLLPLPFSAWSVLPGREFIVELQAALGDPNAWHPFTMTPDATWNALFSLVAPLALLVCLAQLNGQDIITVFTCMVALFLFSAILGYLQALGMALDFYRVSNPNSGLFANRNHQALMLAAMLPASAALAIAKGALPKKSRKLTQVKATAPQELFILPAFFLLVIFTLPLVFVTGSRAGIVFFGLALLSAFWILRSRLHFGHGPARKLSRSFGIYGILVGIIGIICWVLLASERSTAVGRFFAKDLSSDPRFEFWVTTLDLARKYFPFGSGVGSFDTIYRIGEPSELLQDAYINHAHNDYVELILTGGMFGILILVFSMACVAKAGITFLRDSGQDEMGKHFCYAGLVILGLTALASIVDYPARTPIWMCITVLAAYLAIAGPGPIACATANAELGRRS